MMLDQIKQVTEKNEVERNLEARDACLNGMFEYHEIVLRNQTFAPGYKR